MLYYYISGFQDSVLESDSSLHAQILRSSPVFPVKYAVYGLAKPPHKSDIRYRTPHVFTPLMPLLWFFHLILASSRLPSRSQDGHPLQSSCHYHHVDPLHLYRIRWPLDTLETAPGILR